MQGSRNGARREPERERDEYKLRTSKQVVTYIPERGTYPTGVAAVPCSLTHQWPVLVVKRRAARFRRLRNIRQIDLSKASNRDAHTDMIQHCDALRDKTAATTA